MGLLPEGKVLKSAGNLTGATKPKIFDQFWK